MKGYKIISISVLLALFIGFLAGIAGDAFSGYYLRNISVLNDLYLPQGGQIGEREVIIQEAGQVIVEEDSRIQQVAQRTKNIVFGVYQGRQLAEEGAPINRFYSPIDSIAQAVPVTSDGWLLTYLSSAAQANGAIVAQEDVAYEIEEVVYDQSTGLAFIKVDAQDFPAVKFSELENIQLGQKVLLYSILDDSLRVPLVTDLYLTDSNSRFDLVRSVEGYDPRFQVSELFEESERGAPVVNLNNEVVGISMGNNEVLNATYIQFQLRSLLSTDALARPYVGINYIPVADMHGYDEETNGVVVSRSAQRVAVAQDSPLFGELNEGDVITAVEGISINDTLDFASLLYDYRLGDTVTLTVVSDGEQSEIDLLLQERQ